MFQVPPLQGFSSTRGTDSRASSPQLHGRLGLSLISSLFPARSLSYSCFSRCSRCLWCLPTALSSCQDEILAKPSVWIIHCLHASPPAVLSPGSSCAACVRRPRWFLPPRVPVNSPGRARRKVWPVPYIAVRVRAGKQGHGPSFKTPEHTCT